MMYVLWSACTWALRGLLCTCRYLWVCPYTAIQFLPQEPHITEDIHYQLKQFANSDRRGSPVTPGSPDQTTNLHTRLSKTEKEILSLKTRITCERTSWERRFSELQRKQEELRNQLVSETLNRSGLLLRASSYNDQGELGVENGEVFDGISGNGLSRLPYPRRGSDGTSPRADTSPSSLSGSHLSLSSSVFGSRPTSALSSTTSVGSWRSSPGPHRVFVPHSPMDLQLGHRVRILLLSGRISTGIVRFIGHLQGEPELHLGVELETPDQALQDGSHGGHSYFECKPGYGAFVPFNKLLMAWE